jgi:choline dehydrogenase-like flavoprotein
MSSEYESDVVVVGSGLAGGLTAARLATAGVRVLILEAGPIRDRAEAIHNLSVTGNDLRGLPEAAYPEVPHAPKPATIDPAHYLIQKGPDRFSSGYERQVGGTTWHWLGTALRLVPADFEVRSRYGVGVDWPLTYAELEPWYAQAETELGVAGDDADGLVPRSSGYPLPAIPPSYLDARFGAAVNPLGLAVIPTPAARNSKAYDNRPRCCGNHSCIPLCPVQAKYDATVHVSRAVKAGAQLLPDAVASQVEIGIDGLVTAIKFKRPDGSEQTARGRLYVIAAHAVETPKLLLASRTAALPNGVANSSGQVGRNLMDHPTLLSYALAADPVYPYRGPLSTSGIEQFRDGDFRSKSGAFRIEIGNDGWSWPRGDMTQIAGNLIAEQDLLGSDIVTEINGQASRHIRMASLVEQLPDPENRVTVAFDQLDAIGLPRPVVNYKVDSYTWDGMAAARKVHEQIYAALNAEAVTFADGFQGAGHIMGTYRMGTDPTISVVDADERSHDHLNLFLTGSGVFPTAGCSNPSLTIAALALRTAVAVRGDLGR